MNKHGQETEFMGTAEARAIDKLDELKGRCLGAIKRHGALAEVALIFPGKSEKLNKRSLCPGGPWGRIFAQTHDGKKMIVMFSAAETLTKLEETRNDIITGRFGSGKIDESNTGLWMGANRQESLTDRGGTHNKKGPGDKNATCVVNPEQNVLF